MLKKSITSFLVLILITVLYVPIALYAEQANEEIYPLTVDSYKQWLKEASPSVDKIKLLSASEFFGIPKIIPVASGSSSSKGLLPTSMDDPYYDPSHITNRIETLAIFNDLPRESQETFVSYLNDKILMGDIIGTFIKGENATFANGDIKVSTTKKVNVSTTEELGKPESRHELELITVQYDRAIHYGNGGVWMPVFLFKNVLLYATSFGFVEDVDNAFMWYSSVPDIYLDFNTSRYTINNSRAVSEVRASYGSTLLPIHYSDIWEVWGESDGNSGQEIK